MDGPFCDRTVRIVLRTIYATGLRISEALHLTAAQIHTSLSRGLLGSPRLV